MARASGSENPLRCVAQRTHAYKGAIRTLLGIAVVDEDRATARAMAGFDVAPTVADDKAGLQVDLPHMRRFQQQPRLRLAAGAACRIIVRTDADAIQP